MKQVIQTEGSFTVFVHDKYTKQVWRGIPVADKTQWYSKQDFLSYISLMGGYSGFSLIEDFERTGVVSICVGDQNLTYTINEGSVIPLEQLQKLQRQAANLATTTFNALGARRFQHTL